MLVTLVYLAFQTRQNTMAIETQLNIARSGGAEHLFLTEATSSELQAALAEDRVSDITINQERVGIGIRCLFGSYRTIELWWQAAKPGYNSEFVEWVEEQRAKAT